MVTPLTVSFGWLRAYVASKGSGADDREARVAASRACGISGKRFARCEISGGTLTVPVSGGSGVLKRRGCEPMLSEHGKWRREHLGAWNAAYGRTPYYAHLMPEIEGVYARSEGMTLEEFNSALLQVALGWLDIEAAKEAGVRLDGVREEARNKVNEELSIFDAIFRLGKYGVFAL